MKEGEWELSSVEEMGTISKDIAKCPTCIKYVVNIIC